MDAFQVPGGDTTTQVTAAQLNTGNVIVRSARNRLVSVLVQTATGVAAISIFDSSTTNSGTVIGVIPIGATGLLTFNMPAANGIVLGGTAGLTGGPITISTY